MVTNPISSNQVVDVPIDLGCLEVECKDLNSILEAIITKVCTPIDLSSLDFECLDEVDNQLDLYQQIITKICEETVTTGITFDPGVLEYCSTDSWACGDNPCLVVENSCDPGNITLENVLQAVISRQQSLSTLLSDICNDISSINNAISALDVRVTQLENTCCQ